MSYRGLSAELYDLFFAHSMQDEEFYRFFIERAGGRSLELACGTGRLLVPYLAQGFAIEGVDSSPDMLQRCRDKAHHRALQPILYEQKMQELSLPNPYTTIIIPFCSLMLITQREDALEALRRCYRHLMPGGQLLISLYAPWRELEGYEPGTWRLRRSKSHATSVVLCHESLTFQPWEQLQRGLFRYEIYQDGNLTNTYLEEVITRWYGRDEMTMMLESVGFEVPSWYGDYTFEPASDHHETLVALALRR